MKITRMKNIKTQNYVMTFKFCRSLRRTVYSLNTIKPFVSRHDTRNQKHETFCIDIILYNFKKRKRILELANESCLYSTRILLRNVRTRIYSYINSIPIGLSLPFDSYYLIQNRTYTRNFALHMNFKTSYHLSNFCFFPGF